MRKVQLFTTHRVPYKKYNDFKVLFPTQKDRLESWLKDLLLNLLLKYNTVEMRHSVYRSTRIYMYMHIRRYIFIRIITSFYESEYL